MLTNQKPQWVFVNIILYNKLLKVKDAQCKYHALKTIEIA